MGFKKGEGLILNQGNRESSEKTGFFEGSLEGPFEGPFKGPFEELFDIVSPKAREIIKQDYDTVSACMARPYPLVVERARGSIIEDIDGREYIDFVAGIAVMNAAILTRKSWLPFPHSWKK